MKKGAFRKAGLIDEGLVDSPHLRFGCDSIQCFCYPVDPRQNTFIL
jgi:hypothetical protein